MRWIQLEISDFRASIDPEPDQTYFVVAARGTVGEVTVKTRLGERSIRLETSEVKTSINSECQ